MTGPDPTPGHPTQPAATAVEPGDEATGLPWPRTWPGVYLVVLGSFVVWVALLVALGRAFS